MKQNYFVYIFFGMMFISHLSFGQNRYAVHFKFKPQANLHLDNPSQFLSAKSINRKIRFNIPIDSLDLPISNKYLEGIQPFILANLYNSHWFNAAIVVADPSQVALISDLPYVEKVVLAAPGPSARARIRGRVDKFTKWENLNSTSARKDHFSFQTSLLGIDKMHEKGYKGENVTIAVFDAGFPGVDKVPAFAHLFSSNLIVGSRNFVDLGNDNVFTEHSHGTRVLSLIALDDPELLVSGAPQANYILCLTEYAPTEYKIEEYNWVKAAEFSDSLGVDIINSSLGYLTFDDPSMDYSQQEMDGNTALTTLAANIAAEKGILVVTSAGNDGREGESSISAPADGKGILAIGAVNDTESIAGFSSQGPTADGRIKPELSAFGQSVILVNANGNLAQGSGTSFSAPQITALAAGLWGAKPEWSKDQLIENLMRSASQAENPDNLLGHGIPDFTLAYFGEILNVLPPQEIIDWNVYPNPLYDENLFIDFGRVKEAIFTLYGMSGNILYSFPVNRNKEDLPFEINVPGLASGIYLLEMKSDNLIKRTRLIKK